MEINNQVNLHLFSCVQLFEKYPSLIDHIEQYCNDNPWEIGEQNNHGWTPVHFSAFYSNFSNYLKVLSILVNSRTANSKILSLKTFGYGFTPLHLSVMHLHNENGIMALKLLIENGVNVNEVSTRDGSTALHILIKTIHAQNNCPSIVYKKLAIEMLIKAGTHLRLLDKNGYSVLHLLATRSDVLVIKEILKKLIDWGINFFDTDQKSVVFHLSNELQGYLGNKLKWNAIDTDDIEKRDLASKL